MKHSGASMSSCDTTEHPQTHAEKLRSHRSRYTTEPFAARSQEEEEKRSIAAVLKEDKQRFRRLHLPPEVTCTAVNEHEPIRKKPRRQWHPLDWVVGPMTDRRLFNDYAPKSGDVLEVVPRYDGLDAAVMSCEVEHVEGSDNQGVLGILKFLGCDDKFQEQWSKDLVTRRNFHFCKREMCTSGGDQTVHIRKWRFLTIDLDGPSPSTISNGGSNTMPATLIEMTGEIRSTMRSADEYWNPPHNVARCD